MIARLRQRLTYANVTATLALFIALGGTSYAAVQIPRNSVGADQLRPSSVRSSEVKDRGLQLRDLSLGTRSSLRGARGPAGPQGPAGGSVVALGLSYRTAEGTVPAAGAFPGLSSTTATCDAGQRVTGGGLRVDSGDDTSARESYPNLSNTAWTVRVGNDGGVPSTYTVFAICASG